MGRRRKHNLGLPVHLYLRRGSYIWIRHGEWHNLGPDYHAALIQYARLETAGRGSTVAGLLDEYFHRVIPNQQKQIAPSTLASYRHLAEMIRKEWGTAQLTDVRRGDVQRYLDVHPNKPIATNAMRFFKQVMAVAEGWGYVERNPLEHVKFPQLAARQRVLTDDEIEAIRARLYPPIRVLVDVALVCACRVSEVCGIKHADIHGGTLWLRRSKTKDVLPIVITPELQALLDEAKSQGGKVRSIEYLMLNERRKPFDPRYVSQAFSAAARAAGVPDARFHDLRRSSADREQETAQKRLGHSDPRTTRKHYLVTPQPVMPLGKKKNGP